MRHGHRHRNHHVRLMPAQLTSTRDPWRPDPPTLTHAMIAMRAYWLWQSAGRPEGRDWEFWLEAEKSLTCWHG